MPAVNNHERATAAPAQDETDEIVLIAKALAHPARVGIVRLLHQKQTCIGCDIVEEIGLAQSTASEHLGILKAAGVIAGRSSARASATRSIPRLWSH